MYWVECEQMAKQIVKWPEGYSSGTKSWNPMGTLRLVVIIYIPHEFTRKFRWKFSGSIQELPSMHWITQWIPGLMSLCRLWRVRKWEWCNSISALTIKPWLGAERLLLVSDLNTNKTTTTITIILGAWGFIWITGSRGLVGGILGCKDVSLK